MAKIAIGAIVNGYKILKRIFKSIIPSKSLFKVKCIVCGAIKRMTLKDIETKPCECVNETKKEEELTASEKKMYDALGTECGKYIIVGFLKDSNNLFSEMKYKRQHYIVRCSLCGKLCIMSSNNLSGTKSKNKNVKCRHKLFFDKKDFNEEDYYLDESFY